MAPTCPLFDPLRQVQHAYLVLLDCCFLCIKEKKWFKKFAVICLFMVVFRSEF